MQQLYVLSASPSVPTGLKITTESPQILSHPETAIGLESGILTYMWSSPSSIGSEYMVRPVLLVHSTVSHSNKPIPYTSTPLNLHLLSTPFDQLTLLTPQVSTIPYSYQLFSDSFYELCFQPLSSTAYPPSPKMSPNVNSSCLIFKIFQ